MKAFLIQRLRNAAIDMDARGNQNLAALITEAIEQIENPKPEPEYQAPATD